MFDLGPHAGFIWLSYLAAALCVIGLVLWVWTDEWSQRRRLGGAGGGGVRRGSCQQGGEEG